MHDARTVASAVNKDIEAEAKKHPEVELVITDGQDKTDTPVAQCGGLIVRQVDVLLVKAEGKVIQADREQAIDQETVRVVARRGPPRSR